MMEETFDEPSYFFWEEQVLNSNPKLKEEMERFFFLTSVTKDVYEQELEDSLEERELD